MNILLLVLTFFINYVLLGLVLVPVLILPLGLLAPDFLRLLDQAPNWPIWLEVGLIFIPALFTRFGPFQRFELWCMGVRPASGEYRKYIEAALAPLIQRKHLEGRYFHLYLNPDNQLNAFAFGNNNIAVNLPMFEYLSLEELSGVLAHEIGHVEKGHTQVILFCYGMGLANLVCIRIFNLMCLLVRLLAFIPILGWFLNLLFLFMSLILNLANTILSLPMQLFQRFHSRSNEYEADRYACEAGLGENLAQALVQMEKLTYGGVVKAGFLARIWNDHPDTPARIQRIREYEEKHPVFY